MEERRIFTADELRLLSRSALERVTDAVAGGDPDEVDRTLTALVRAFRLNARTFSAWSRMTIDILDRTGLGEGAHRRIESAWKIGAFSGVRPEDVDRDLERDLEELRGLCREGALSDVVPRYVDLEGSVRRLHSARVDWVSWLWSIVYRSGGPDALESCLRELADATLLRWMTVDVASAPDERVRVWSESMMGNFATFRIEELDDRFRFVQDPCGTCGRRLAAGAYEPPLDLAVVRDDHPVTYGGREVPIYRTHVAVMHWAMPPERIGTPWPLVRCPAGTAVGPCTVELMKEPLATPPDADVAELVRAAAARAR